MVQDQTPRAGYNPFDADWTRRPAYVNKARIEVNPDKLKELNDNIRKKDDRPLPYYKDSTEVVREFYQNVFSNYAKPYHFTEGYPFAYRPLGNFLKRPIVDIDKFHFASTYFTMQHDEFPKHCQIMERDFFRCVGRVGMQNLDKWCKCYWEDLFECSFHSKSRKRVEFLKEIRKQTKRPPLENIPAASTSV